MSAPGIGSTCVTQVFNDRGGKLARKGADLLTDERFSKFVVTFDSPVTAADVSAIDVVGPAGYSFAFDASRPFSWPTQNGYIDDRYNDCIWYLAFDKRGFLANGTYTITVRFADGHLSTKSRELKYDATILESYLKNRGSIEMAPSGNWQLNSDDAMKVTWTTLKDLDTTDAYYCLRGSRGSFVDMSDLAFYDDIFTASAALPDDGLNRRSCDISLPMTPGTRITWFTEILDSNRFEDVNIAIFQPPQHVTIV